ncbi:MAG: hypothetical protein ACRECD_11355 [Burkholderiaceae bacterium]
MRSLTALLCIVFGGYIFSFAFKRNAKRVVAALLGGVLVVLGFYMLQDHRGGHDKPGFHDPK